VETARRGSPTAAFHRACLSSVRERRHRCRRWSAFNGATLIRFLQGWTESRQGEVRPSVEENRQTGGGGPHWSATGESIRPL